MAGQCAPPKVLQIYNLTFSVDILVAKVFSEGWGSIRLRRNLMGEKALAWQELKYMCGNIVRSKNRDRCNWN